VSSNSNSSTYTLSPAMALAIWTLKERIVVLSGGIGDHKA
jgi:hypothetical protein